jgi:hypothetical protein
MKTSADIVAALIGEGPRVPAWVELAAIMMKPPKFGSLPYETTAVNFYPEVTTRQEVRSALPAEGLTRRGKPRLQRRRLDLVALVQPHYKEWEPFVIGVEVKVSASDLAGDAKMSAYLDYCHIFYLAVPSALYGVAHKKIKQTPALTGCGLLTIREDNSVVDLGLTPTERRPTTRALMELYAELLLRPFKLARGDCKKFIQNERTQL